MITHAFYNTWTPRLHGLLRIVVALLFMQHGSAKLLGIPHVDMFNNLPIFSLFGIAGILELVGGFFILIGLFTRPIAFLLSGEMAIAYFMIHAPHSFFPLLNQGELAALYSFVFLYFSLAGAGAFSVDGLIKKADK